MTFATRMQDKAKKLVGQFSSTATLRRVTHLASGQSTFDPVTGTYTDSGSTTNTQEYPIQVTPPKGYSQMLINGTLVQQNDFQVFVAAKGLPIVPDVSDSTTQDTLIYNGVTYQIIDVDPVPLPKNIDAGYWLQCRA